MLRKPALTGARLALALVVLLLAFLVYGVLVFPPFSPSDGTAAAYQSRVAGTFLYLGLVLILLIAGLFLCTRSHLQQLDYTAANWPLAIVAGVLTSITVIALVIGPDPKGLSAIVAILFLLSLAMWIWIGITFYQFGTLFQRPRWRVTGALYGCVSAAFIGAAFASSAAGAGIPLYQSILLLALLLGGWLSHAFALWIDHATSDTEIHDPG